MREIEIMMYSDSEERERRIMMGSEDDNDSVSIILKVKENIPYTTKLLGSGNDDILNIMSDEDWEELGRDISNNTRLKYLSLYNHALNDHKMSFFFRGLTRSSSIRDMRLHSNGFSVAGVRSMVPFLQTANNLMCLNLSYNNFQSEGFNTLLRALGDSTIERLNCIGCGIESIEIDNEHKPKHLELIFLSDNIINADGCRGLAKLLEGEDATLKNLYLDNNKIDDEGVGILVDALQNNTSLRLLDLEMNNGISKQGQCMLLKLVDDVSSINATLQSNHTLEQVDVDPLVTDIDIHAHIDSATKINHKEGNPDAAAMAKVIKSQLHSATRAELAELQGVGQSLYSEINPLHLPEVIALIGRHHDQGEVYMALKSSIAGLISIVNRKRCLQQEKAYYNAIIAEYRAKVEAVEAEIATIEAAEGHAVR